MNNAMEYKYLGIELSPAIFQELLIKLFDGKQFSRQDALEKVVRFHVEQGGIANKTSYINDFKAVSRSLKNLGMEKISYGIWRLTYEKKEVEIVSTKKKKDSAEINPDKELGTGEKSVYVYYYDSYKKLAELQGKNIWECKIGRTDIDPISRVIGQAGTCYPELPHIAIIFYCDDSSLLEKAFHSILKMKNRWIPNAPGTEWFITSPEEIEDIYNKIIS